MIDMSAIHLSNEFTANIRFSDYVNEGYLPPLPTDFNKTNFWTGRPLVAQECPTTIKYFIQSNIPAYTAYIVNHLYENDIEGGLNAVARFLRNNVEFLSENDKKEYALLLDTPNDTTAQIADKVTSPTAQVIEIATTSTPKPLIYSQQKKRPFPKKQYPPIYPSTRRSAEDLTPQTLEQSSKLKF